MAQLEVTTEIDKPADEVWKIAGRFGDLSWFPGIDATDLEGDVRTLTTANGSIRERLLEQDDDARRQVYSIFEAPFPVEEHKTTMTVQENGDGSIVSFAVVIAPDSMAPVMESVYQAAGKGLRSAVGG